MELEEYDRIYQHETTHFWYRTLHALVLGAIGKHARRQHGPLAILDAGCGTGGLMSRLRALGQVTGTDLSARALEYCARRGHGRLVQSSVSALPFRDAAFDVVVCADVLYHRAVADDRVALRELERITRPGGLVLLHLAAHAWLMSHHDRTVHTARRYSRRDLAALIAATGLRVVHTSYTYGLLLPAAVVMRWWSGGEQRSDLRALPRPLNGVLTAA
ncbi:MAG: class I SAM-dependent methyltransferase, partial [Planctomycetota bacterium]